MNEQILIDFAHGEQIYDQRSMTIIVNRNPAGGLYIVGASYADATATNGRKLIIIKSPDVGEITEPELAQLINEAKKRVKAKALCNVNLKSSKPYAML